MKTETKMNVRLLRQIKRQILKEPRQFKMDMWFEAGLDIPNCQTAACIAGWAMTLDKKTTPLQMAKSIRKSFGRSIRELGAGQADEIMPAAQKVLGLSDHQAERLFLLSKWPYQFFEAYMSCNPWTEADGRQKLAKIAAARIDFFIKTKGEDWLVN